MGEDLIRFKSPPNELMGEDLIRLKSPPNELMGKDLIRLKSSDPNEKLKNLDSGKVISRGR